MYTCSSYYLHEGHVPPHSHTEQSSASEVSGEELVDRTVRHIAL